MERNTYLAKHERGRLRHLRRQLRDHGRPGRRTSALSYLPGGAINYTYVDDPALNELIAQAAATFDEDEKIELMQQAAKIVHDQVYDNVMYTQNLYVAHSSDWDGFISKPSELLSIVNPVSLANAHKVAE